MHQSTTGDVTKIFIEQSINNTSCSHTRTECREGKIIFYFLPRGKSKKKTKEKRFEKFSSVDCVINRKKVFSLIQFIYCCLFLSSSLFPSHINKLNYVNSVKVPEAKHVSELLFFRFFLPLHRKVHYQILHRHLSICRTEENFLIFYFFRHINRLAIFAFGCVDM